MRSWQRVAETAAVVGAVALCVIVAGPGGALENLFLPIFGGADDPAQRLEQLAFGIPLAILLVPGLALWAWAPGLRPAGAAMTVVATLTVTVALAVEGRLTTLALVLLSALWLLGLYQVLTVPPLGGPGRRSPALVLSVAACAAPWVVQAGRLVLADVRQDDLAQGDHVVVILFTLVIVLLLALPLARLPAFAPAAYAAAVGASIYAMASLRWPTPAAALPQVAAILAVATAVAYIDTVRQMAGAGSQGGDGAADQRPSGDQPR